MVIWTSSRGRFPGGSQLAAVLLIIIPLDAWLKAYFPAKSSQGVSAGSEVP